MDPSIQGNTDGRLHDAAEPSISPLIAPDRPQAAPSRRSSLARFWRDWWPASQNSAPADQLRELRIQSLGRPLPVFYAFDPARQAVVLMGGDNTGDARFYERMVPHAERLWKEYLDETAQWGDIKQARGALSTGHRRGSNPERLRARCRTMSFVDHASRPRERARRKMLTRFPQHATSRAMGTLRGAAAAAAVFVLGSWIAACGSKGDGSSNAAVLGLSGSPMDQAEQYCQRFASAFCAARSKCCASLPPDGAISCEQSVEIDCSLSVDSQQHNGWVLSADSIQAALDRLQKASDSCGAYELPNEREAFAPKTLMAGASCPGFMGETCPAPLGCVNGKCIALIAQGGDCDPSDYFACAAGLTCSRQTKKCQPVGKLGDSCEDQYGCASGLVCAVTDTNALTNEEQCYKPRAAGEPCQLDGDCATKSCGGSTCDACKDSACGSGGHCDSGACVYVFNQCGADPTYFDH